MVEGYLGGPLESETMEKLILESEGNPLYAIETTKLLVLNNTIQESNGKWLSTGNAAISIPTTVKEVILRRLDWLNKKQRRILDAASVAGSEFDIETLLKVIGKNKIEVLEDLEALENEGKLICQRGPNYRFTHEMIRQVSYESISSRRRAEIHLIIGKALEGRASPEILALHFRMANDSQSAIRYSLMAGEELIAKGCAQEAVPLLEYAVQTIGEDSEDKKDLVAAYDSLGYAYLLQGRLETANTTFEKELAIVGLDKARARTLLRVAECWSGPFLGKGNQEKEWLYLELAQKAAQGDDSELGHIAASRAICYLWNGDFQTAENEFKVAIDSMISARDRDSLVKYRAYYADALLTEGKIEEALDQVQEALQLAKAIPGFSGELEASYYAGVIYLHIGSIKESIHFLDRCVEIATQIGEFSARCYGLTYLTLAWELNGNNDRALESALNGYDFAMKTESSLVKLNSISSLLHMSLKSDSMEKADRLYLEASEIQKEFKWGMHSTTRCLLMATSAEYLGANGKWQESELKFQQSFEMMQGTPAGLLLEALARTWYASLLFNQKKKKETMDQINRAEETYLILHNSRQVEKLKLLKTDLLK